MNMRQSICLFLQLPGMHPTSVFLYYLPANTYCQGSAASAITFTYGTCIAGSGGASGYSITAQWYSNTFNLTDGGTAVGSPISGSTVTASSGTISLTPLTTTTSTLYYYCVITWSGVGTCNVLGTLTSGTTSVTINAVPTVTASGGSTAICNGGSTTMSAAGVTGYTWSPATGLSATTGATVTFTVVRTEQLHLPAGKNIYLYDKLTSSYTELHSGGEYSFAVTADKATQGSRFEMIAKPGADNNSVFSIVPNPAVDKVDICCPAGITTVTIADVTGAVVYSSKAAQEAKHL